MTRTNTARAHGDPAVTERAGWRDPRLGTPHDIALPSGTLRYFECGTGPALVFVHGYLVNANLWRAIVPLLATSFRCLTPDWPLGSHRVPMPPTTDLSPPGVAGLIAEFLAALDLRSATLVGNDSGSAYAQLAAATRPERIGRLVLTSGETPSCTWPPTPGGFGLLKAAAATRPTHRALYQVLRVRRSWRWPSTYGWLAKHPVPRTAMDSYVRPVLTEPAVRADGRRAIAAVSERHSRAAADTLIKGPRPPTLLLWAAEDRVFPLSHARRYAGALGAPLVTVPDSYTYLPEDNPGGTAGELARWLDRTG